MIAWVKRGIDMTTEKCSPICKMTICDTSGCVDNYYKCGRVAKYITPADGLNKSMFVCGIHKESVNSMYKKRGLDTRCKKIQPELNLK